MTSAPTPIGSASGAAIQPRTTREGWMGALPPHWRVVKIKHFARIGTGHTPSRSVPEYWENCEIPWVTTADIKNLRDGQTEALTETEHRISKLGMANSAARLHPAGTVFLSRTASVGFSGIMGVPMATSQDFATWTCGPELQPEYLLFSLRAMAAEFDRLKFGSTHNTIYMPDIEAFRITLPPAEEQRAIVGLVRRETARIDALIGRKERLLALLEEKRQALVSHVVTKGLDPSVPMSEPGEEWIGRTPRHWSLRKLGHLARIGNGSTPSRETPEYWAGEGMGWLNSSVVKSDRVSQAPRYVTKRAIAECHLPIVQPGAVLVALTGEGKTRGMATLLEIEATISQHLAFVTARDALLPEYLLRTLHAGYDHLRMVSEGVGGTKGALTCEELRNLRIPAPPVDEQRAIVMLVANATATTRAIQFAIRRSLELLRERRQSLIAAAVTGQIDASA